MPKSPVQMYTLRPNQAYSMKSSNTPRIEIPTGNSNNIKIIITESTPAGSDVEDEMHTAATKTHKNVKTKSKKKSNMASTTEPVENPTLTNIPLYHSIYSDFASSSDANWTANDTRLANTDRYIN